MAGQGHLSRKELQEDEVHDAGVQLLQWIQVNRTRVTTFILIVLVAILGIKVTTNISRQRTVDAGYLLSEARRMYLTAQITEDSAKRAELLDGVLNQCQELEAEFGNGAAGTEAILLRGNVALLQGDNAEAISYFEKYRDASTSAIAKAHAWQSIAIAHENAFFADQENKTHLESAIAAYQKAVGSDDSAISYIGAEAKMQLARLAAWQGDLQEAKTLYSDVVQNRQFQSDEVQMDSDSLKKSSQLSRAERSELYRDIFRRNQAQFSFQTSARQEVERLNAHVTD